MLADAVRDLGVLLKDRFEFDRNLDLIADDESAGLERNVVGQTVILAIDACFSAYGDDLRAPRRGVATIVGGLEDDWAGHVPDRQIASDFIGLVVDLLDLAALEGYRRIFLNLEEVGRS